MADGEPSKAIATLVLLKDVPHLKLVTSLARKDDTKTFSINDGINHIKSKIGDTYLSATLFAASGDVTLTYSRKREPQLVRSKATLTSAPPAAEHNRAKTYLVAPDRPYLKALQVSDAEGRVKPIDAGQISPDLPLHRNRRRAAERNRAEARANRFRSSISAPAKAT